MFQVRDGSTNIFSVDSTAILEVGTDNVLSGRMNVRSSDTGRSVAVSENAITQAGTVNFQIKALARSIDFYTGNNLSMQLVQAQDNLLLGRPSVINEKRSSLSILGDADSDAAAVQEIFLLALTGASDPTDAVWAITSTQSAGYDFDKNVDFSAGFSRAGVTSLAHLYGTMGFADSSQTIDLTTGVYTKITNEGDSLFSTGINRGLTFLGDSIQVPIAGDYEIAWDVSGANVNATDEIEIHIFVNNVGQDGKGDAHNESAAATDAISGHTILNLAADAWISLRVRIVTAGDRDFIAEAGNVVVKGLFAN